MIEMRDGDLQELYVLLEMYARTYDSEPAETLMTDVKARCQVRGIRADAGNSRRAGRRRTYTDDQNRQIMELHAAGRTVRQIAEIIGCSTGHVQQLITEQRKNQREFF